MYNYELNEQWTNKLRDYCKDKKVLIIGNSLSLFGDNYESLIDSYDVVVRIGKGVPYKELQPFLGTKTDCWMFSTFRAFSYVDFINCPFKVLNICQQGIYQNNIKDLSVRKLFFDERFQIYRDYFLLGSLQDLIKTIKQIGIKNRLS